MRDNNEYKVFRSSNDDLGANKKCTNTRLINLLKTAFKIYILPNLGNEFVLQLSSSEFSTFCYEIDIISIRRGKILKIFDESFNARVKEGKVSAETKRNYRFALSKFFTWLQTQSWYIVQIEHPKPEFRPKKVYPEQVPARAYSGQRFYALKEEELTLEIQLDLKRFQDFWSQDSHEVNLSVLALEQTTDAQLNRKNQRLKQAEEEASQVVGFTKPIFTKLSKSTLSHIKPEALRFFGWCVNIEGYDIKELSLELLTRKAFYRDYIIWLTQKRNRGTRAGITVLWLAILVAKYKTFRESKTLDWSDIPLIKFLKSDRQLFEKLNKKEQVIIQEEKWEEKEISHPQAVKVLDHLYQLCAPRALCNTTRDGERLIKRALSSIVGDWQTYLITKILVYAPVRQQEIRKLRIDSTLKLVEDSQGIVRYAVKIKEHKNSSTTGKPRYYPLQKILTKDISTWINEIRPLAINAPETIDSWLAFWGYSTKEITNLENLIQKAEAEETPNEKYCESRRIRLKAMKNRIEAWETAKHNAENCDHLFFGLGRSHPKSFCFSFEKSHHSNISYQISQGVGNATLALFGEAKFLNPHGFRNVGAKHLRAIGRAGDKEAFSAFLGHSVEIDDDYADTLTNDYDLIECVVDNWWNEP